MISIASTSSGGRLIDSISFSKYEGLGNDFVVIDDIADELEVSPESVVRLCDRRFGIGADGLMLVKPSAIADFRMDFRNSDGTVAEMCGNGIRCFGKHLYDAKLVSGTSVSVETGAGVKVIDLILDGDCVTGAAVDMGQPELKAAAIPVAGEPSDKNELSVSVDGINVLGTCVSMGNPHFVLFVEDTEVAPVQSLGAQLEVDSAFPKKTNVEFAKVLSEDEIVLRVWERGVGETLACGTGACATAVAAHLQGLTGRHSTVHLPGGRLEIDWREDGRIIMTGPAREVFRGVFSRAEFLS